MEPDAPYTSATEREASRVRVMAIGDAMVAAIHAKAPREEQLLRADTYIEAIRAHGRGPPASGYRFPTATTS